MTDRNMLRASPTRTAVLVLMASLALASCNVFKKGDRRRTPTIGERIPILSFETRAEAETELKDTAIVLPAPETNAEWAQPGGSATKVGGHLVLAEQPAEAWHAGIGKGSSKTARLNAAPVVGAGKVFTVDIIGQVSAFDAKTGALIWRSEVKVPKRGSRTAFGGGVSYGDGRVYVATGYGIALAFDAETGKQLWERALVQPLRGAPSVAGPRVFFLSQDNQLHALDGATGEVRWTVTGTVEPACILGAGAPAISLDTVVAGFCSGELNALRAENGRTVWQDQLARTGRSTAMAALADIDGSPVIDRGRVFAIGHGGRMVALELATGQRVWERNFAGVWTPWAAGEFLYVVTVEGEVLCITRTEGKLRWVSRLPQFRKEKKAKPAKPGRKPIPAKQKDPIQWAGPVLASERLWMTSSNRELVAMDAYEGKRTATIKLKAPAYLPPVVAGGMMYVLTDDGTLTAYR
ncbi:PQQ-like beta-propeller repeat protein [Sandarakinorhabdus oryzae]|uniref:PQQ-like beta-propeller repeat protein n=1 Tax=Sandarakinorhabdus oryzae TaxID=2675220 RepID=UPI001F3E3837|nr:PQQ-like beta-propeller repeat protein [Sandarakinorhabdus oryzae]